MLRKQCEENIQKIMTKGDFTTLYTHPKLMGHYFWKDDQIHTRKQRVKEIIKVFADSGKQRSIETHKHDQSQFNTERSLMGRDSIENKYTSSK